MNIGIIGLGLIGKKRAKYLGKGKLIAYADILPASNITFKVGNGNINFVPNLLILISLFKISFLKCHGKTK